METFELPLHDLHPGFTVQGMEIMLFTSANHLNEIVVTGYPVKGRLVLGGISALTCDKIDNENDLPHVVRHDPEVFPNPSVDRLTIVHRSEQRGQLTARLFDATGKVVCEWPERPYVAGKQEITLPLRGARLIPGNYILRWIDGAGQSFSQVVTYGW
jgi:hypothetical protein